MTNYAIGWDIGGAHVKVAVVYQNKIITIHQMPCLLWQGLAQLESAVQALLTKLPTEKNQHHAITMTGELVDLFANRHDGVQQIIKTMTTLLSTREIQIFCGKQGLLPVAEINETHYDAIASANWLASAMFVAKKFQDCLFVDIGSTTTDILLCENSDVVALCCSDYGRLISGELIYSGIVRTPVMAIAQAVLDNEQNVGVMAEHFATTADVYRLTGELSENHDQTPTADGAEKTVEASARRLSRMVGDDFNVTELARWQAVARDIRQQQKQRIQQSCAAQLARHSSMKKLPLIGAGVGRFLVQEIAVNLNCDYIDFSTLFTTRHDVFAFSSADCAPAVAIAYLLTNVDN
jgi:probable H4MPT-linked C1 transfer pathway protein